MIARTIIQRSPALGKKKEEKCVFQEVGKALEKWPRDRALASHVQGPKSIAQYSGEKS